MAGWLSVLGSPLDARAGGEILVKLAPEARAIGIAVLGRLLGELGATVVAPLHPEIAGVGGALAGELRRAMGATFRVRLPAGAAPVAEAVETLLAAGRLVEEVSPNPLRITQDMPDDPDFAQQWGLDAIGAPAAWERQRGRPEVVVAVIDSGVEEAHPDLQGALLPGRSFVNLQSSDAPEGWRYEGTLTPGTGAPDEVGHGTHVAGIIGARTDNGVGIAGIAGECRVLPVRVLARMVRLSDGAVKGGGTAADVAAGIRWAVNQGVAVVNLSFGFDQVTFAEREAIDYAIAHRCVPVAAMGNEGPGGAILFPAALRGVVAVGAVARGLGAAGFSQAGTHVALAAPGVGILSTVPGSAYAQQDGTSMATAFVSGVAALLRSANAGLEVEAVRGLLMGSARRIAGDVEVVGAGLVDAAAALRMVD